MASNLKEKNNVIYDVLHMSLNNEEASDCYIALKEAIGNAFEASEPNDLVDFKLKICAKRVKVKIRNRGSKFNPNIYLAQSDYFNPEATCGRGLVIISKLMYSMLFVFYDDMVELNLIYKRR